MARKTVKRVSVPNLKAFGATETKLWAKKLENFLLCYIGKWAGGRSLAHQHGCCNINAWRFSKPWTAVTFTFFLLCINLKLAEIFQNGAIYIV